MFTSMNKVKKMSYSLMHKLTGTLRSDNEDVHENVAEK